jgi:hypothetical protein
LVPREVEQYVRSQEDAVSELEAELGTIENQTTIAA